MTDIIQSAAIIVLALLFWRASNKARELRLNISRLKMDFGHENEMRERSVRNVAQHSGTANARLWALAEAIGYEWENPTVPSNGRWVKRKGGGKK